MAPSLFISSGSPLLDRRFAWADGMMARGETYAAAELMEETLARAPEFLAGWFLLASAREQMGDRRGASEAYRRALALDPEDRMGIALRLARLGEREAKGAMSAVYVRTLFDQYAPRFDHELREALHYCAPDLLRNAIESVFGLRWRFSRVLDLGCGTGLMGEALRDKAVELVGVDLSPEMTAAARRKGIYDRLIIADLVSFLEAGPEPYQLIVAADVLVYFDDLAPVLERTARCLAAGGALAFTVETHPGEGMVLRDTLRYAHGEAHVRAAAAAAALRTLRLERASSRRERNTPVEGLLAVLGAPQS
jgi:predicted TPR repeat methyltransferase